MAEQGCSTRPIRADLAERIKSEETSVENTERGMKDGLILPDPVSERKSSTENLRRTDTEYDFMKQRTIVKAESSAFPFGLAAKQNPAKSLECQPDSYHSGYRILRESGINRRGRRFTRKGGGENEF